MGLSEESQALLAADLCRLLRSNGLPTRILVHDHNFKHASSAVQTLRLARARLDGCVDGTAWHAYQGSPNDLNDEELTMLPIYVTEQTAHTQRPRDACSSAAGDVHWSLANVVLGPLKYGAVCALKWNLALDETGGPVLQGGPKNCRGLLEVAAKGLPNSGMSSHERSPEWYVLAHASAAAGGLEGCLGALGDAAVGKDIDEVGGTTSRQGGSGGGLGECPGGCWLVSSRLLERLGGAELAGTHIAREPSILGLAVMVAVFACSEGGHGKSSVEAEAPQDEAYADGSRDDRHDLTADGTVTRVPDGDHTGSKIAGSKIAGKKDAAVADVTSSSASTDFRDPSRTWYGVLAYNHTDEPVTLEIKFEQGGKEWGVLEAGAADAGSKSLVVPPRSIVSATRIAPPCGVQFLRPPAVGPRYPPRALRLPPAVFLRSVAHHTYLAAHGEVPTLVYQSELPEGASPNLWEVWRPIEFSSRAWRLISAHGTLLGVDLSTSERRLIQLNGANALAALELTLFFFDDGTIGLCGDHGNVHMPGRRRIGSGWGLPCLQQGLFGAWEAFEAIPAHI